MSKRIKAEKDYFIVHGGEVREGDKKWSDAKSCWIDTKDYDFGSPVTDYVCIERPQSSLESKKPNWYKSGVKNSFQQEF